ncbi:MAG TPA: hypothetical protein VF061_00060 [Gemmatimonadales bacterium]|jgi:hypothetical protein
MDDLTMDDRFELEFEGRRYTVQRGESAEAAAEGGGAPVGRLAWYITLGPKAITQLPARPGESDHALRDRIRRWLVEHPEMPGSEDITLGGG